MRREWEICGRKGRERRGEDEEVGRCEGRGGVEWEEWGMMEDE